MKERIRNKAMMPSGIDNFHDLITHRNEKGNPYLFVDKTLFIREFLDSGDKITLITRPRRFGKTLTLSMLQHFLASEVKGQSTKGLFNGLNISKYPGTMKKQGQYPVIFLTLKEVKGKNFEEFFERMKSIITETFKIHRYLLNTNLSEEDYIKFKKILNETASQTDYERSLKFLSELLYQHTGRKVVILLDEYDTPIHDAYIYNYYEDCRSFLANMFNRAFKGNDTLHKALITGILKVAKASLFSELNNVKVYTILDDARYPQYFGFTEEETDDLLDRAGLSQKAHQLKEMYNGYSLEGYTLYNPFSIVSFISSLLLKGEKRMQEALKPYWVNTGGTHLIADLVRNSFTDLEAKLTSLIQGEPLKTAINEDVIFNPHLRNNPIAFWSLLLLSGYLKVVDREIDEYGDYQYYLLFPNEEIKKTMRIMLLDIVSRGLQNKDTYTAGMRALVRGDLSTFTDFLQDYFENVPSFLDTKGRYKEQFFHGLLLGMTLSLSPTHRSSSNRISGKGAYDIALEPKDISKKGVILELKVTQKVDELQEAAQKAREQALTKKYAQEMKNRGVRDILFLGIAFCGNELAVATE